MFTIVCHFWLQYCLNFVILFSSAYISYNSCLLLTFRTTLVFCLHFVILLPFVYILRNSCLLFTFVKLLFVYIWFFLFTFCVTQLLPKEDLLENPQRLRDHHFQLRPFLAILFYSTRKQGPRRCCHQPR